MKQEREDRDSTLVEDHDDHDDHDDHVDHDDRDDGCNS